MKPSEFWNSTYREINVFTQSNLCRMLDDFRQEIRLQEAVTDKLIRADAMSNRRPKVVPIQKSFEKLFPQKQDEIQSPKEIAEKMRKIMKYQ